MSSREWNMTLLPSGKGELRTENRNLVSCKAISGNTLGAYSLFEVTVVPQGEPPLQAYSWEQQAYYILEGELVIQQGDRSFKVTAGSFVDIPKGILHTFKNVGTSPTRLLAIITPMGYEKSFVEWVSQYSEVLSAEC
jgi:mannose-6-phosphate isomerase-like protein (cupin superfamily)